MAGSFGVNIDSAPVLSYAPKWWQRLVGKYFDDPCHHVWFVVYGLVWSVGYSTRTTATGSNEKSIKEWHQFQDAHERIIESLGWFQHTFLKIILLMKGPGSNPGQRVGILW